MQNLNQILELAETQASPMGLTIVDTRVSQQGKHRTLEITICRKGGRISLTDCEELSRKVDKVLDEQVPPLLDGSYLLEVQSPGLDRQLKTEREIAIFSGEEVEVKVKDAQPVLGDFFTGKLHSIVDGKLKIEQPKPVQAAGKSSKKAKSITAVELPESIDIDWSRVSSLRLHPTETSAETASQDAPVELN